MCLLLMEEIWLTSWGTGSLSHYLQGFIHPNGGDRRISEPSTVSQRPKASSYSNVSAKVTCKARRDHRKRGWASEMEVTNPENQGGRLEDHLFAKLCGCFVVIYRSNESIFIYIYAYTYMHIQIYVYCIHINASLLGNTCCRISHNFTILTCPFLQVARSLFFWLWTMASTLPLT